VPKKFNGSDNWNSKPLTNTKSPILNVPAAMSRAAINITAVRPAVKMTPWPKFNNERLVLEQARQSAIVHRHATIAPPSRSIDRYLCFEWGLLIGCEELVVLVGLVLLVVEVLDCFVVDQRIDRFRCCVVVDFVHLLADIGSVHSTAQHSTAQHIVQMPFGAGSIGLQIISYLHCVIARVNAVYAPMVVNVTAA
jgi:hypothetical protein